MPLVWKTRYLCWPYFINSTDDLRHFLAIGLWTIFHFHKRFKIWQYKQYWKFFCSILFGGSNVNGFIEMNWLYLFYLCMIGSRFLRDACFSATTFSWKFSDMLFSFRVLKVSLLMSCLLVWCDAYLLNFLTFFKAE